MLHVWNFSVWMSSEKAQKRCMMFLNMIYQSYRKQSQSMSPQLVLAYVTDVGETYMLPQMKISEWYVHYFPVDGNHFCHSFEFGMDFKCTLNWDALRLGLKPELIAIGWKLWHGKRALFAMFSSAWEKIMFLQWIMLNEKESGWFMCASDGLLRLWGANSSSHDYFTCLFYDCHTLNIFFMVHFSIHVYLMIYNTLLYIYILFFQSGWACLR
jgi:hypothetical protein